MEELLKLPSDVLIILAMTLFLAILRVTDPKGGSAARNLRSIISELFSHWRNQPSDKTGREN